MTIANIEPIYKAVATITGGRSGHAITDDGIIDMNLEMPKVLGGKGGAPTPEHLFAVGYGACFQGALNLAGKEMNIDTTGSEITCEVGIGKDGDSFGINVVLTVKIKNKNYNTVSQVSKRAHELCPYSKAVRNNINVKIINISE